jgi:hypothetical protein
MFTFYFDNTIVNNPINWSELSEKIERNDDLRGLFIKIDKTLTFTEDAYAYLYSIKSQLGYCQFVSFRILKECGNTKQQIFTGNIRISDCKFNLSKCIVECSIEDDSYGARIFNNKSIKTFINSGFSKNGLAITPANTYRMFLIEPSTNVASVLYVEVFDVMECFEYLVKFMTDGQMNVVSDWYTNLPSNQKICITTGAELRKKQHLNVDVPSISFDDLFKEMNKKFNLGMSVELINNVQTLRIEPMTYFFNQTSSLNTNNIPELLEYIDTYNLYSNVKLGCSKAVEFDNTIHSLPPIRFLTFNEENYIIQGQCNIDRELDLSNDYVIDSNVIEQVAFTNTNDTGNDKDIFMIQYEPLMILPTYVLSVMWNDITTQPPVFFNETLTNDNVALRWDVQGAIAQFLNAGNTKFMASSNANTGLYTTYNVGLNTYMADIEPFAFQDDSTPPNNDPSNSYSNTLYEYTANANGIYSFRVKLKWKWEAFVAFDFINGNGLAAIGWRVNVKAYNGVTFQRENSSLTPIKTTQAINLFQGTPFSPPKTFTDEVFVDIFLAAGETARINIEYDWSAISGETDPLQAYINKLGSHSVRFLSGCEFECVGTADGGGIYKESTSNTYHVSLFKYDYPISENDWITLKSNPSRAIMFGIDNASKKGWINNIDRNSSTGMASIELISNLENTSN